MPSISIKCVIIGDQKVGKTCFLNAYVNPKNEFEREYIPTVFDTFIVSKVQKSGNTKDNRSGTKDTRIIDNINLGLYDTSGNDENKVMRLDTYSQTTVFILAFAIDDIRSYENVRRKWHKEIKHSAQPNIPILLVGMKVDARKADPIQGKAKNMLGADECWDIDTHAIRYNSSPRQARKKTITYAQGVMLHKEIGATRYMECSSFEHEGIKEVFEEVLRLGYQKK